MSNNSFMDPNFVPDEYKVPYDIIELPSQGLLYKNKKSSVKVEYLTAYDENILTSPNLLNSGKVLDVLLERKVKDLGFDTKELVSGDRMAILLYLRTTGLGNEYEQLVFDGTGNLVPATIDLASIKTKNLTVKPDEKNEFDFEMPISKKKVKFRFLSQKDIDEISEIDKKLMEKNNNISTETSLRLERSIMEIDGERDKLKISHILKNLKIMDVRKFNKYVTDIEPGLDLNVTARTQGGESIETFLRIGRAFWNPEV
ncbi:hypothetical protein K9M18_06460 [Candidatus Woesearchaeota archaeon]|nr:hypothetical protein [Candidatus Woesearchaeota archaeon]